MIFSTIFISIIGTIVINKFLVNKLPKKYSYEEEELIMLQHIKEDMQPTEKIVNGFLQLGMELPNGYRITLGDYGREKKNTKPNDNILHLHIRYFNLCFPEVFDRNFERGFSLNEVRVLKDLIHQEKQLDTLAKIYFNRFIEKVERRYK